MRFKKNWSPTEQNNFFTSHSYCIILHVHVERHLLNLLLKQTFSKLLHLFSSKKRLACKTLTCTCFKSFVYCSKPYNPQHKVIMIPPTRAREWRLCGPMHMHNFLISLIPSLLEMHDLMVDHGQDMAKNKQDENQHSPT